MFSFIRKLQERERRVLYTCFFAFFCNGALALTQGSALPDLKAAYGLSDTVSGIFLSAHSIGNLIAALISGLLPLYLGRKRSVLLMSALAFLGFFMMILWGNPVWLFLGFVGSGLGRGSVTNFSNQTVNQLSGGSPVATNLLHACFAIGAILTPMLYLLASRLAGFRAGLGVVVALGCISLVNLSRMRLADDRPSRTDKVNSTLVFLKNPSFLILAMMMFCYLCSEYAINGWLVTYIQSKEALHAGFGKTGAELNVAIVAYSQSMATLMWTIMLCGRILCALLSTRISQKILMMVSSFGIALFFGLMLLSASIPMVTFAVAGLGLCMAGISPMIYSDAAVFTNTYPMATSIILVFGSAGGILMPTIVGALAECFGFGGGMSAIFATVVLLVVFSVLNVTVKTRLPQEAQA